MEDAQPKAQPYTFDLGHLLCTDPNPLPTHPTTTTAAEKEPLLATTAQQCAQSLINQLLTACPIQKSPDGDLHIKLPDPTTELPREKPVPKEKEKTKWERFAEKKGIKGKRKDGKVVFDEGSGEWKPKFGFKGKKGEGVGEDWLVEVDEKEGKGGDGEGEGDRGGKAKRQRKGR